MFISKSFTKPQLRWAVPEKEGYAIHYALIKVEHLLRDVHFTLETDHENLTRIYSSGSPKVLRWQLELQSYDCEIRHIKGELNLVADHLSRLCPILHTEEYIPITDEFLAVPESKQGTLVDGVVPMLAAPLEPLVALPDEIYHDIKQVHNEISGHHGVDRTLRKLMRGGHKWKYMRAHVNFFIKNCPFCQKISHLKVPIHTKPFVTSSREPMSRISFDSIGVLTEDAEWGYNHVLVVIDNFTRWVELYPTRGATAIAAARALLDHSGRFGVAAEWVSDRGSQFANEVMEALANLLGTEHCFTLPSSKEENAIVERANKEVMRHLRAFLFEAGKFDTWSTFLPFVQRIMNSTVHESIGTAPVHLLLPSLDLDRQIMPRVSATPTPDDGDPPQPLTPWIQRMVDIQDRLVRVAQLRVDSHAATHTPPIDDEEPIPITTFPPNSFVLVS